MTYRINREADLSNTSWVEDLEVAPVELVRALGAPQRGTDDHKVTGRYSFVEGSRVFTVYDWKATALYDDRLPSPLDFWNSQRKEHFSLGSNCKDVSGFRRWLLEKVLTGQETV